MYAFFNIKIICLIIFFYFSLFNKKLKINFFFKKKKTLFRPTPYPNFSFAPSSSSWNLSHPFLFSRSLLLVPHKSTLLSSSFILASPFSQSSYLSHTHIYSPTSIAHVKFRLQDYHHYQHYSWSIFSFGEGN